MKNPIILFLLLLLLGCSTSNKPASTTVESNQHTEAEKKVALHENLNNFKERNNRIIDSLIAINDPRLKRNKAGEIIRPNGVSASGKPLYYSTNHGVDVYTPMKGNELKTAGSLGLRLFGEGVTIGVWDGGAILQDHEEFGAIGTEANKIEVLETESQVVADSHPTAVTSTIIASGLFHATNFNVTGIAPQVDKLLYRNWDDAENEVTDALSTNENFILSNHSYGFPIYKEGEGEEEGEYQFTVDEIGVYNALDQLLDNIANVHPYYLRVVAAGNEGDLAYPDQEYEGYYYLTDGSSAKNILTIGSVSRAYSSPFEPIPSGFSSAGPTSDGRIKPELVAVGEGMPAATWNSGEPDVKDNYSTVSGTSFAAPATTGGLALLQELYKSYYTNFMLASTLKGLACHTADDIRFWKSVDDIIGPDAKTGFGMLNLEKAAALIVDDAGSSTAIHEQQLENLGSKEINLLLDESVEKLSVTLSWNDPYLDDLTTETTLVHDLDVRITQGETVYYPWKLDATNYSLSATKGDNIVDNIEKIEIDNPSAGAYTITINHKGTLAENQSYSLIVSVDGEAPTLNTNTSLELTKQQLLLRHNSEKRVLTIMHSDPSVVLYGFDVYDLSGRLIASKTLERALQSFIYNTNTLSPGVYIVKARGKGIAKYGKFSLN